MYAKKQEEEIWCFCVCVRVCAFVCVRERVFVWERPRERSVGQLKNDYVVNRRSKPAFLVQQQGKARREGKGRKKIYRLCVSACVCVRERVRERDREKEEG